VAPAEMTEKLLQHAHCSVCSRAVKFGDTTCSEECKQKMEGEVKKRKRLMYIMYGAMAFFLLMLFVPNLL